MSDYSHSKRRKGRTRPHRRLTGVGGSRVGRRSGTKSGPRASIQVRTRFVVRRARKGDFSGRVA